MLDVNYNIALTYLLSLKPSIYTIRTIAEGCIHFSYFHNESPGIMVHRDIKFEYEPELVESRSARVPLLIKLCNDNELTESERYRVTQFIHGVLDFDIFKTTNDNVSDGKHCFDESGYTYYRNGKLVSSLSPKKVASRFPTVLNVFQPIDFEWGDFVLRRIQRWMLTKIN